MRLDRWLSFAYKMSNLSGDKDLVRKVLKSNNPKAAVKNYYSSSEKIHELRNRLQTKQNEVADLKGQKRELEQTLHDLKTAVDHPKAEYWNNKYEKKLVRYQRPIYDGHDLRTRSIPVTNFIQPNDLEIRRDIEQQGLEIENPLKINEAVPEIYQRARKDYDYEYDRNNLGELEYWLFPFETRELNGDCEDWAHNIASYLIAAGVPSWRVRVIAGGTMGAQGHSTVYVLADDLKTWHHLNSTSPSYSYDNLKEYPVWGDESQDLNIDPSDVWVAFNDRYGWQDFESEESESNYKASGFSDKLEVEPW